MHNPDAHWDNTGLLAWMLPDHGHRQVRGVRHRRHSQPCGRDTLGQASKDAGKGAQGGAVGTVGASTREKENTGTGTASHKSGRVRADSTHNSGERQEQHERLLARAASTGVMKPVTATRGRNQMVHNQKKISMSPW